MADVTFAGLFEVEPVYGDSYETAGGRRCDLCDSVPVTDAGPPRAIYHDPVEGLYVCEGCVGDYLTDAPEV